MDRPFNLRHLTYLRVWPFSLGQTWPAPENTLTVQWWVGWVLCPPPGLLGGPCGPSILLFALGSSSFSTASCCNSPFGETIDHLQWAVTEAPSGLLKFRGDLTLPNCICVTPHIGAYWISAWFWMSTLSVSRPRTLGSGGKFKWTYQWWDLCYIFDLPFLMTHNHQYTFWGCDTNADSKHPQLKTTAQIKVFSHPNQHKHS